MEHPWFGSLVDGFRSEASHTTVLPAVRCTYRTTIQSRKKGHRIIPNGCLHITPGSVVEYGGSSTEEPAVVTEQEMMQPPENFNIKKPDAAFKEWLGQATTRLEVNYIKLPSPLLPNCRPEQPTLHAERPFPRIAGHRSRRLAFLVALLEY